MKDLLDKIFSRDKDKIEILSEEELVEKKVDNLTTIRKEKNYGPLRQRLVDLGCYNVVSNLYQACDNDCLLPEELIDRIHSKGNMQVIEDITQVNFITLTEIMCLDEFISEEYCRHVKNQYEQTNKNKDYLKRPNKFKELDQSNQSDSIADKLDNKIIHLNEYKKKK